MRGLLVAAALLDVACRPTASTGTVACAGPCDPAHDTTGSAPFDGGAHAATCVAPEGKWLCCDGEGACAAFPPVDGTACCPTATSACDYDCNTGEARRCECARDHWACHTIACGDMATPTDTGAPVDADAD